MKNNHLYHDQSMWKGAKPDTFSKANTLRNKMTVSEKLLWEKLKGKKLNNYKFRRQHPIQNFIADFYCHELDLIIEIDGEYHNNKEQFEYDKNRTGILNFNGIEVLRFTNFEVKNNVQLVLHKILIEAERIKSNK
jgi:very-short-patch-repair endonuclease